MLPLDGPTTTRVFLVAAVTVITAYDFLAWWLWGHLATISHVLLDETQKNPVLALGLGVLIGHVWWRSR